MKDHTEKRIDSQTPIYWRGFLVLEEYGYRVRDSQTPNQILERLSGNTEIDQ